VYPVGLVDLEELAEKSVLHTKRRFDDPKIHFYKATLPNGKIIAIAGLVDHFRTEEQTPASREHPKGTNIQLYDSFHDSAKESTQKVMKDRKCYGPF
jgi:hypothetical protein